MQNIDTQFYSLSQSNGKTIVSLRPANMQSALEGKLSPQDVITGLASVNKAMQMSEIRNDLINGCSGTQCPICQTECTVDDVFRAIPNGNEKAKVMFVNKTPSQYETLAMLSHCDKASVFLSLILDKMHVDRSDVYLTDIVKCYQQQMDEVSVRTCIEAHLLKEITFVNPEVIVFNGQNGFKTLIELGYVTGLNGDILYGTIYTVSICGNQRKVMAMFDLDKVLQKTGDDYSKCKTTLWTQILTAFRATENGG